MDNEAIRNDSPLYRDSVGTEGLEEDNHAKP